MDTIRIKGARQHNLKNVDLELPRDKLIVISGLSGSGKSSLAFDTIYAEGQRRYVESLSSYARQFLGIMDKPDVDYIEGLSPAISIEQKTTNRNPRSTVGTITEIYDYLRLLFARVGIPHDPVSGKRIEKQTIDQIIDRVLAAGEGAKAMVLAPVIRGKKGTHQRIFSDAKKAGFSLVRVNGELHEVENPPELDKNKRHQLEVVIDRLVIKESNKSRVAESLETALSLADGLVHVGFLEDEGEVRVEQFSENYFYPDSALAFPEIEPRLFSFNSPFGACPECAGLGMTMDFDRNKIMPDPSLSFNQGGLVPFNPKANWNRARFEALSEFYGFSLDDPLEVLDPKILDIIFDGGTDVIPFTYTNKDNTGKFEYNRPFDGILADLRRRYRETGSDGMKQWYEGFMTQHRCESCQGLRLRPESLGVKINGYNIADFGSMTVRDARTIIDQLELNEQEREIAKQIRKEISDRLRFLVDVGLGYLNLERSAGTLSGGEAQRIRLATQIGSSLMGVLYILDEPSIGLHQRDNERLLNTLFHLRDLGNTLIVVEHDEQTLRQADYIVDLGPGAGIHGGEIVAAGTPEQVMENTESVTGRYLSGDDHLPPIERRREGNGQVIELRGATEHNLKSVDVDFPLGKLITITGVSGSGKSTLLSDILHPALANRLHRSTMDVGAFKSIHGQEHIDKIIAVDQSPIGRTPRSNPATYVGLFTPIRELFAQLPESKMRGYGPGRFSFNVKGGRCEKCEGAGTIKIEMHFLSDVYVVCDVCGGKRFNRETLEVHFKGKSIYDVLEMSIEEATEFFKAVPKVLNKLQTLNDVGLGYIKLGQSALTLSGGEAQRVKLASELSKRNTGKTLYILDEPTTGLHFADVKQLLSVLHALVDKGNTIILIEHNLDVIAQSDHLIDLGLEGGDGGGTVVVTGTPEEVARHPHSHTARFLREVLGDE